MSGRNESSLAGEGLVVGFERRGEPAQIGRQRSVEEHFLAGGGVFEAQLRGMQRLPAESVDDRAEVVRKAPGLCSIAGGVKRIGHQRMADMRHMHADLMRA